jgi:hypothetical protein
MKKKSKKKDGNNVCQLGIASILRNNYKKYDAINNELNSIVHSKDKDRFGNEKNVNLEFSKETDDFFKEKLKIDPEDYCKDGSDVCQKGLSSYYRDRVYFKKCYDKMSEEVHNKNNEYDYEVDELLKECTGKKIEELDSKCEPKNTHKLNIRKEEEKRKKEEKRLKKEEEERRQRVHDYFMKREKEWNESRRIARKKKVVLVPEVVLHCVIVVLVLHCVIVLQGGDKKILFNDLKV